MPQCGRRTARDSRGSLWGGGANVCASGGHGEVNKMSRTPRQRLFFGLYIILCISLSLVPRRCAYNCRFIGRDQVKQSSVRGFAGAKDSKTRNSCRHRCCGLARPERAAGTDPFFDCLSLPQECGNCDSYHVLWAVASTMRVETQELRGLSMYCETR